MKKSRLPAVAAFALCVSLLFSIALLHGDEETNLDVQPATESTQDNEQPLDPAETEPDETNSQPEPATLDFTLDIRDGSHLVCSGSQDLAIPLTTEFGEVTIPLRLIASMEFFEDHRTAVANLHNRDRLTGALGEEPLKVNTAMGEIAVPTNVIVRLEIKRPEFKPDFSAETAAKIDSSDAAPVALQESDDSEGWRSVPQFLRRAQIYSAAKRPTDGKTSFRVVQDGIVYLACHFGYEGNASGGWKAEALSEADFIRKGWKPVSQMIAGNGRTYTVLRKPCGSGETFNLRCNKYSPPLVILLRPRLNPDVAPFDDAAF